MTTLSRPLFVATVALATFGGCTFGNLADYEIRECNPRASSQAEDDCNRLNQGAATCTPFQCDPATKSCVQRPRDDDKDGDPSEVCGGGDCADDDGRRSSKHSAAATDIGARLAMPEGAELTFSDANDGDPAAAFISPQDTSKKCIQVVRLARDGGPLLTGCTLLRKDQDFYPRQPFARIYPGGVIGAFVATDACGEGRVGFAYARESTVQTAATADCAGGAALPATALATSGVAAMAWYRTPVAKRIDAANSCATLEPAALVVARVDSPTTAPAIQPHISLADAAVSVRSPAVVAIGDRFLIASPANDSVAIWTFDGTNEPTRTNVDTLPNARSVSLGVSSVDGVVHVAIIAELGCKAQKIAVATGTVGERGVVIDRTRVLAENGGIATSPSIAHAATRGGWIAAWITDGPSGRALRLTADAEPVGITYEIAAGALLIAAGTKGSAFGFEPGPAASNRFVEAPLRCP